MNFNTKEKELFIFDLDGTLVDAYKAIEKSINFTLLKLGYEKVSSDIVRENIGNGDRNFVAFFVPKHLVDKALAVYRKHHKTALKKYAKARPYAKKVLYDLKRKNKKVALATNRPSYYTNIILESLEIKKYFNYTLCADEIKSLKPNPKILHLVLKTLKVKRKDAVFAGDMDVDMETAKRANMDALFIKGGSSSLKQVAKYKNKKVVMCLKRFFN